MSTSSAVAVIGSGYVGTVVAACLADLGRPVTGVEIDPYRLAALQAGKPPFYEPRLDELLARALATGNLRFTGDVGDAVGGSVVTFMCVGTPPAADGTTDMKDFLSAASEVGRHLRGHHVVILKSTVPIGTYRLVTDVIAEGLALGATFSVVSNPEFLRQGSAIDDFLVPERVVLGGEETAIDVVAGVLQPILDQRFPGGDTTRLPYLLRTSMATAETLKYAANAFLATKISFINEIANICERTGADVTELAVGLGLDSRIGPTFLDAGIGWGGSCFGKDLDSLITTAEQHDYDPALLKATVSVNRRQREVVIDKLRQHFGSLEQRRIALLGLAFKPDTDDLRDAPSVTIAERLLDEGAVVTAHDPVVTALPDCPGVVIAGDPYQAADGADAVVLLTEWAEYATLDLDRLRSHMRGLLVLDGRNVLEGVAVTEAGLRYEGVGRPIPADVRWRTASIVSLDPAN